jgi:hypothetical protein
VFQPQPPAGAQDRLGEGQQIDALSSARARARLAAPHSRTLTQEKDPSSSQERLRVVGPVKRLEKE